MGKRKVGFKKPKKGISNLKDVGSSDDEQLENDLEALLDDEIDSYNAYKEQSLKPKTKSKKRHHSDSDEEKEVFGLDVSSDEGEGGAELEVGSDDDNDEGGSEEDEDDNDEDILGGGDHLDTIPDSHAWGRKARLYHNTDYVDQDFGGFEGSDAELAEQEEIEAKEIQKRLTAELDEEAFIEFIPAKELKPRKKVTTSGTAEVLKVDFESMSIAEKRKLVQRECPEVIHMLDEYKEKLEMAKGIKNLMKDEDEETLIKEFYQTKYHTILNYCINISYYLYLRSTNPSNCKGHPVIKRILQFRRLLDELDQFNPLKIKSAITQIQKHGKAVPKLRKPSLPKPSVVQVSKVTENGDAALLLDEAEAQGEAEKRGITYEMAKNKGLTPARQKVQRNPRVKHRLKFRKATIRRKGQVRTPRTEIKKYDGESSGIKTHLTKSIKIKY